MNDPVIVGAYFTGAAGLIAAVGSIIASVWSGYDLRSRLKKAEEKSQKLEEDLESERKGHLSCQKEIAQLRGVVSALQMALKTKGVL